MHSTGLVNLFLAEKILQYQAISIKKYIHFQSQECGVLVELICDLTNTLLKIDNWDLSLLFSPYQQLVLPKQQLEDNIPFGKAKELVVKVSIDLRGKVDIYIDDIFALSVGIEGTDNTKYLESAPLLAIHAAACPKHKRVLTPCEKCQRSKNLQVKQA